MDNLLLPFSDQLAAAVDIGSRFVAAIEAHPRSAASGVLFQPDVLVTAEHVLKGRDTAAVTLPGGERTNATLAGKDEATGLAVFRVPHATSPEISGPVRPGNLTLAVGRSLRNGPTASMGIVAAVSDEFRTWRGGTLSQLIQLDYGFYPNTNGGAVIDTAGRLIGIATSAFSRLGGIAIPVDTIARLLPMLLEKGSVQRGYLGVGLRAVPIPESLRELLLQPAATAVILLSVEDGGAAAQAGLTIGDVLTGFDETPVRDVDDVQAFLAHREPGVNVTAHLIRGGKRVHLPLTLGRRS